MEEDFDMKCENCPYCEHTIYGIICKYNGEVCPTDGSCYKNQIENSEVKDEKEI